MSDAYEKSNIHDAESARLREFRWKSVVGSIVGVLTFVLGVLFAILHIPERLVDQQFYSALTLTSESDIYQEWINPRGPIYLKFYVFNVTNPEEIVSGVKPKLQECGPYTFSMNAPKTNVSFYANHTVSYFNKYALCYEPDLSQGTLQDSLSLMNVPLASMSAMMDAYGAAPEAVAFINELIKYSGGDKLFSQRTPVEVLFGYEDPIFVTLKSMGFVDRESFGFFMDFNESNDGEFLVHTGAESIYQPFHISKWNGNASLNYWTSDIANMINGSDGSFLGRNLGENDTPYIYVPQMCRSMKLEYDGVAQIKGIETLRFRGARDSFANHTINPDNAGFCIPAGNCYDSGIMSISPCKENAPAFVSQPHFYNAAQKYQQSVTGLHPNKTNHESFYFAEPKTGAVLKSHRRLQINMHLQPSDMLDQLHLVRDTIFPMLWIDGSAEIDEGSAKGIRVALRISKYVWITSIAIIILGVLVLLISIKCSANGRYQFKLGRLRIRKQCKRRSSHGVDSKNSGNECSSSLL